MRDLLPEDWKPDFRKWMLGLDAWVDSTIFKGGSGARELYGRYAIFMDHFHVVRLAALAQ